MKIAVPIAGGQPTVLKSRLAWIVWCRKYGGVESRFRLSQYEPKSYPCLAYSYLGSDDKEYPGFLYVRDIEKMSSALEVAS